MQHPLRGFRVLDLTNVLAGPFCCHQLAHLDAEVVKVEVPVSGGLARQIGAAPELNAGQVVPDPERGQEVDHTQPEVAGRARGARAAGRERRHAGRELPTRRDGPAGRRPRAPEDRQPTAGVLRDLRLRPGRAAAPPARRRPDRAGHVGADEHRRRRRHRAVPRRLPGRGHHRRDDRGVRRARSGPPGPGLVHRRVDARGGDGHDGLGGQQLLVADKTPQPLGNENFTASPSGTFATGDGLLNVAANKQEQFEALCRVLGHEDLAAEWAEALNRAGVPSGCVVSVPDALAQPQIRDRGMIARFADVPGVGRDVRVVRTGTKIDGAPQTLGQHTAELLHELGYSPGEIEALGAAGAI